jgi:hypothetical protein
LFPVIFIPLCLVLSIPCLLVCFFKRVYGIDDFLSIWWYGIDQINTAHLYTLKIL